MDSDITFLHDPQ